MARRARPSTGIDPLSVQELLKSPRIPGTFQFPTINYAYVNMFKYLYQTYNLFT